MSHAFLPPLHASIVGSIISTFQVGTGPPCSLYFFWTTERGPSVWLWVIFITLPPHRLDTTNLSVPSSSPFILLPQPLFSWLLHDFGWNVEDNISDLHTKTIPSSRFWIYYLSLLYESKSSLLSVIVSSNATPLYMPCIWEELGLKVKRYFHSLLESSLLCNIYCPSGWWIHKLHSS